MSDGDSLRHVFIQNLPSGFSDIDAPELTDCLVGIATSAAAAWPTVRVEPKRYMTYLAERVSGDGSVAEALGRLRTSDLWLACACAVGDTAALTAFEETYGIDVEATLAAQGVPSHIADEARQIVRTKLFVASEGAEPTIARYSGRGDLRAWARATTVRAAIDLIRKTRREVGEVPDANEQMTELDPELGRLRNQYGEQFRVAFSEAFVALPKRDRTILRYRFVDDLDIDAIGAIYRVHRSTAARWLQQIRERLRDDTLDRLAAALSLTLEELSSILRFIGSQLDVSISSALRR
ncbi:MAG: sigma-70 family RNA polymerase sigma factor [Kofleriaceae bacterium]